MISIADNFSYNGSKPLDNRMQFATVAAMKAFAEASLYNGCLGYVTANKTYYTFDSSNSVDSTTGKWRELETGGGGGASALNDLSDVTISSATSGQVLKNNGSGWVNGDVPSDDTKQPKTLDTPLTIDGASITTVEGGLSSIGSTKQPKTLATPITIQGTQYTTVESALTALNTVSGVEIDAYSFGGGQVVADFEAHVKSHFYDPQTLKVSYGELIVRYITSSGGVRFTNNCPDGNELFTGKEWYIYASCGNPDGYASGNFISLICYSKDTNAKTFKIYQKPIGVNSQTGSWNENEWYESGGGSVDTSKLYSTDDTAETAIADTDYFPFQDVSASGKRKTLWSNVKSVLKTYFDTVYSGIFTNATELAKIGEQNGVPTYDGQIISLPTVHNFDKTNLYSTTEQVVGKWTDGRPLYQRRLSFTGVSVEGSNWGTATNALSGMNVDLIVNTFIEQTGGQYWYPSSGGKDGTANLTFLNPRTSNSTTYVGAVIQYTKTTDAANSFNYASENDYSTSETIVGKWIDGSNIYQKTVTGTLPSTYADGVYKGDVTITVAGMTKLINAKGFFGANNGSSTTTVSYIPVPCIQSNTDNTNSRVAYDILFYNSGTTVTMGVSGSALKYFKSQPYYVTFQYLK